MLGNPKTPDNYYVNVRINHDNTSHTVTPAIYDVTKDIPLLNNPQDYYLSVIDFTIPLSSLPIAIAKIQKNQPNPNLMECAFSIQLYNPDFVDVDVVGGYKTFTEFVTYIPSNSGNPPVQNNPNKQVITAYYNIYSYTDLLNMFNNTLESLYQQAVTFINDQFTAGHISAVYSIGDIAPYYYLTPETQLISLVVSGDFISSTYGLLELNNVLAINDSSLNYLQAFNLFYTRNTNDIYLNSFYKYNFYYNPNGSCDELGFSDPTGGYIRYTQEYNCLDLWSDLRKIFITTTSLRVKMEDRAVNYENGVQTGLIANSSVLFDYAPVLSNSASSRTLSYYVPQSQYRLMDIITNDPVKHINLEIFWQDTNGDNFPINLQIYQCVNIKLGFFKKSLYKNYYPNN